MALVSLDLTGVDSSIKDIDGVLMRLKDLTPVLQVIGEDIQLDVSDNFDEAKTPEGTPWQTISATTQVINPIRIGGKPLSDTRRLAQSINVRTTKNSVSVGTNIIYGPTHQFGNPANRLFGKWLAPIPARRFLPLDASGNPALNPQKQSKYIRMLLSYILTGKVRS